ncbi:hypothetical protein DA099_15775, partial [Photobacterium damselae]
MVVTIDHSMWFHRP